VRSSYRINKLLREMVREVDLYEDERKKIFEEYGEEEKGVIKIKEENEEVARDSLEELLSQEVEIDLPNVDLETLEVGHVELSPLEMQAIEPLLLEEKEEPELPPGM
ncbi:hypothetical protein KAR91_64760, partial [Candidatus Pacearchaeota archaeon]|nr:hypothetical protein [Candidatus Pacearchaeota archaeon]